VIEIRRERGEDAVPQALVAAMVAETTGTYDMAEMPTGASPEELSPPQGAFVVIYEDGDPVAGGGVKRLSPEAAEIKRMFVVPEARSRGHARRLLGALEEAAADLGYRVVRLDTGPQQPHALALYESAGYRSIPNYNGNSVATYWGEKVLAGVGGLGLSDRADRAAEADAADAADAPHAAHAAHARDAAHTPDVADPRDDAEAGKDARAERHAPAADDSRAA
jgi:GNAT superfamily N-acetyltransferase